MNVLNAFNDVRFRLQVIFYVTVDVEGVSVEDFMSERLETLRNCSLVQRTFAFSLEE